jgi:L-Ala-D/L-Glu epimerase / N-acetyl-D-glutamate racemase
MPRIAEFEIFATDLPFRKPFKHAAAVRATSDSLFLKCTTDTGVSGFGECLPRDYVSGETRQGVFRLLKEEILPHLLGREFADMEELKSFLVNCDGKAPADWVSPDQPQTAAWCAVDLALLDAFGKTEGQRVWLNDQRCWPAHLRYSPVISSDAGLKKLLLIRLLRFPQVKIKVEKGRAAAQTRRVRRFLGKGCNLRLDANMAWTAEEALTELPALAALGVTSCEQPVAAADLKGLARLVRESSVGIMVDESLNDRESLDRLISGKACTAVNVRISKCGGLVAAYHRCREALAAGLTVQIGCQVGESSLLSAAHLTLVAAVTDVTYAEGCFGRLLLGEDPAEPLLQFRAGGQPPPFPTQAGLGVTVQEEVLRRYAAEVCALR